MAQSQLYLKLLVLQVYQGYLQYEMPTSLAAPANVEVKVCANMTYIQHYWECALDRMLHFLSKASGVCATVSCYVSMVLSLPSQAEFGLGP